MKAIRGATTVDFDSTEQVRARVDELLKEIVKREDIPFLAQSAYDDACRPGNPKETSVEDITKLYESLI